MKKEKWISFVLAAFAALAVCVFCPTGNGGTVPVYAEEEGFILKTDNDGDLYVSGYTGKGGDIVIPKEAVWIGKQAFYGNRSITSVTFPKECWYWVDEQAFAFCPNLKKVTFNGSIGGIGEGAFYGCTALQSVTFGGDVSLPSLSGGIGSYAFSNCLSLRNVTFSDPNAKVDMLGGCAFSECISLESVSFPSELGNIYSDVFVNCYLLKNIGIPQNAVLVGTHINGYMYGKRSPSDKASEYIPADGSAKCYIDIWQTENGNYAQVTGSIAQTVSSMSVNG